MRSITIPISGMTCASCVTTIEGAFNNMDGVEGVTVNLAGSKASVTYDPGRVTVSQLVRTVTDLGYEIGAAQTA
jgi:Cu+-exporting ATPase